MSGKIFDLTPEAEGPRRATRRSAAAYDEGGVVGDTYLARALEQAALDALRGAEWVVRRRVAAGQGGGEDAVTLALARPRREFDTAEWERTVRRVAADRAVGTAYLARKREERLRRKAAEAAEAGMVQAQAEVGREGGALSPALSGRIGAKRGGGQPLDATVRRGMEGVFQVSFGHVRIHADAEADALNRGVAAIAFTVGSDIFFRAGFYQPQTLAGQHLLAHELTHVVQQRAGSLAPSSGNTGGGTMTVGAADDRHEQEAEATAHRVTAALQRRALLSQATTPGAGLARQHDPATAFVPAAPGVARVPDETVRRFGLGDLWQAVTGAASAAWGGFTGALRGIAQAGYNAVTGTLHWAQAVVTGAGQLAGQAVTVVANAAHNATQFAVTVGGKVVGLVGQATAQAIGNVMQTVAAARTALAAVTSMAAFLARKLHDAPAAFVQALQDKAQQVLMGVLGPEVSAILGGAASTMALILKNPLKFLNNLGLALKAGFGMVGRNLRTVLQGGLMSWLSGSLGVTIPDGTVKFDVAGIITLGLNALHLGYDALKEGVIAGLTKQGVKDAATVVGRLETGAAAGFTLLQTIRTKGLAGAWDAITQQVRDSLGSALDGAKAAVLQWVTQHVIQGVIAQLVALCTPVGDIVELLLTIYKAVQFFLDKMRALGQVMATLKDAVTRVATGDVWHAGAQVYNAVVASVPLLLGFIANLLGLGAVGAAVRTALAALTAPVRRIEAKLIALIVSKGQALAATLHGKGSAPPPGHGQTAAATDTRTLPQKQADLDAAIVASEALLKNQALSDASIKAQLPGIQRKYRLSSLTWVPVRVTEDSEIVHIAGQVNPAKSTKDETRDLGVAELAEARKIPHKQFTTPQLLEYLHAHDFPTLSERTLQRRMGEWRIQKVLFWCDSAETLNSFDPYAQYHPGTGNEDEIIAVAVTQEGGIVEFMKAMAQGKSIVVHTKAPGATTTETTSINRALLEEWWKHPAVRSELSGVLRRANNGNHEWIPCELILDVIKRAANLAQFREGVKWVDLQHKLRTDTSWVIYKPDPSLTPERAVEEDKHVVLQGHIGAVYRDIGKGARVPQVVGKESFHDACKAAFNSSKTVDECITAIETVYVNWVWDGGVPWLPIHESLYTTATGGESIARTLPKVLKDQKGYFNKMKTGAGGFDDVRRDVSGI